MWIQLSCVFGSNDFHSSQSNMEGNEGDGDIITNNVSISSSSSNPNVSYNPSLETECDALMVETALTTYIYQDLLYWFEVCRKRLLLRRVFIEILKLCKDESLKEHHNLFYSWLKEPFCQNINYRKLLKQYKTTYLQSAEQNIQQFKKEISQFLLFLQKTSSETNESVITKTTDQMSNENPSHSSFMYKTLHSLLDQIHLFEKQEMLFLNNEKKETEASLRKDHSENNTKDNATHSKSNDLKQQTPSNLSSDMMKHLQECFKQKCQIIFAGKDILQQEPDASIISSSIPCPTKEQVTPKYIIESQWNQIIRGAITERTKLNVKMVFKSQMVSTIQDLFVHFNYSNGGTDDEIVIPIAYLPKTEDDEILQKLENEQRNSILGKRGRKEKEINNGRYPRISMEEIEEEISGDESFFGYQSKKLKAFRKKKQKLIVKTRRPLHIKEEHLLKEETLDFIPLSKTLTYKLKDEILQKLILDIDLSYNHEGKLAILMKNNPNLTQFINEMLFVIGERDLDMEHYKQTT